jgi:hypothetical protein
MTQVANGLPSQPRRFQPGRDADRGRRIRPILHIVTRPPLVVPSSLMQQRPPGFLRVCFDASTLNHILKNDAEEKAFRALAMIQQHAGLQFAVSGANLLELGATKYKEPRTRLLEFCAALSPGHNPLLPFNGLLKATLAHVAHATPYASISIDEYSAPQRRPDGPWVMTMESLLIRAMRDPKTITTELQRKIKAHNRKGKRQFLRMHRSARAHFERLLAIAGTCSSPPSSQAYMRDALALAPAWRDFLGDLGRGLFPDYTSFLSGTDGLDQLVRLAPAWRAMLASIARSIFGHVFSGRRGASHHAGAIDVFQAAYLGICDVFVTDEHGAVHYDHMKDVAQESGVGTRVLNLAEFKCEYSSYFSWETVT